jgi:hypothetical protein
MHTTWRRRVAAAAVAVTVVGSGLVAAAPAGAGRVVSGSLAISGDPGDPVTRGQSYSFSTDTNVIFARTIDNHTFNLFVGTDNGAWQLDLGAPFNQATLVPGEYPGAHRFAPDESSPTMSLSGNGVACDLTGSFTVLDAVLGPNGYVQTFDATFEQRCDGFSGSARGEVHIANPPPPPGLELGVTVRGTGESEDGTAVVHGTTTCNKPATVGVSASVVQGQKQSEVSSGFFVQVDCTPGAPVPWTGRAEPLSPPGFHKGNVDVQIHADASDVDYEQTISADAARVVKLRKPVP